MPVANDIAYSITVVYRYWSQDAHWYWSTSTQLACVPLVVQARKCYSSCFWSTTLSSSLLHSGFHLCARQPPLGQCLSPVSFHAAVCCQAGGSYIVPGATLLVSVQIWYLVNKLLRQAFATQAASVLGFVFVFLSYSSYSSYYSFFSSYFSHSSYSSYSSYSSCSSSSPSFLFCSLAGCHLECTSNSLGATSLFPAGLPTAIKYVLCVEPRGNMMQRVSSLDKGRWKWSQAFWAEEYRWARSPPPGIKFPKFVH